MKTIAISILLAAAAAARIHAQTPGAIMDGVGGYGGPEFTVMEFNGEVSVWGGGDWMFVRRGYCGRLFRRPVGSGH